MENALKTQTASQRRTAVILAIAFALSIVVVFGGLYLKGALEYSGWQSAACTINLQAVQIALLSYHDEHGTFPPAYVADADGKPMHSWRVLILPYLDEEELYAKYDFDEPWDGPHNRTLADKLSHPHFQCPSAGSDAQIANYLGVVGPEAGFVGDEPRGLRDMHDGPHKTIALVEVRDSDVNWMEPRDLSFEEAARGVGVAGGIAADHSRGPNAAYWDGHIDQVPADKETLRAVLTARGGEEFEYPDEGFGGE